MENRLLNPKQKPEPRTYGAALEAIQDLPFLASERHGTQHHRANRKGASKDILEFERVFLRRMAKVGVPMFAHCVIRTPDEQARVFVQGHSNAKPGQSPHQYGFAVDLVHGVHAWNIPRRSWDLVGHIGKEAAAAAGIDIRWGGDFTKLYDPAHWELTGWRSLAPPIAVTK